MESGATVNRFPPIDGSFENIGIPCLPIDHRRHKRRLWRRTVWALVAHMTHSDAKVPRESLRLWGQRSDDEGLEDQRPFGQRPADQDPTSQSPWDRYSRDRVEWDGELGRGRSLNSPSDASEGDNMVTGGASEGALPSPRVASAASPSPCPPLEGRPATRVDPAVPSSRCNIPRPVARSLASRKPLRPESRERWKSGTLGRQKHPIPKTQEEGDLGGSEPGRREIREAGKLRGGMARDRGMRGVQRRGGTKSLRVVHPRRCEMRIPTSSRT
jgi:hypothetical protein